MTDHPYLGPIEFPFLSNVTADPRLLGFPNVLSSFCQFNSAPRIAMFNHHVPQTMIIAEPEFNKTFTGFEEKFIPYTFNKSRREFNCEVLKVIPKYRDPLIPNPLCPQFYVLVLTLEPDGKRHLDYFTVDRYTMGSNGFGWISKIDNLRQVREGEFIDKDMQITHSAAVNGNQYQLGLNLNIVYGSFAETIEDAFVISESAARKLQTTQISQKTINFRMDRRPLNLNGNEYQDKFLPDIGSFVREDGALCGTRPMHWTTVLADTDPAALREPLPNQDELVYIEPGSKILDIDLNLNRNKLNTCYKQAIEYSANNLRCWEDIWNVYTRYKGEYPLTPKMGTLVRTAIHRMIAQGTSNSTIIERYKKATRNFEIEGGNGQVIDFMQAIVTYTVPRLVSKGSKLTDQSGAKGVVGIIYPDECMPVDEFGIRADMMIDMNSPVGRNNPGQLYETGINRIGEFVRRECERVYSVQGPDAAHATLLDYYRDVNPKYADLIEQHDTTPRAKKETVDDAIEMGPRVWIPPFLNTLTPSEDDFFNALTNIRTWANKWGVRPAKIRFKTLQSDGSFKEFVSETEFSIGSKYIFQLHKIPEQFAPGPASVNHIGVPTKANYDAKNFPVSVNPYRYGEDEQRVMLMDIPANEMTRFQNLMANSRLGVEATIQTLLLSEHPSRVRRVSISNGTLAESSAILSLFHNTAAALGVETRRTRNDELTGRLFNLLSESKELGDAIWKTEIVSAKESQHVGEGSGVVSKRAAQKKEKVQLMLDDMELPDEDSFEDDMEQGETEE